MRRCAHERGRERELREKGESRVELVKSQDAITRGRKIDLPGRAGNEFFTRPSFALLSLSLTGRAGGQEDDDGITSGRTSRRACPMRTKGHLLLTFGSLSLSLSRFHLYFSGPRAATICNRKRAEGEQNEPAGERIKRKALSLSSE